MKRISMCVPNKFIPLPTARLAAWSTSIWIQFIVLHYFMETFYISCLRSSSAQSKWRIVWVLRAEICVISASDMTRTSSTNHSYSPGVPTRFIFMIAIILTSDAKQLEWNSTAVDKNLLYFFPLIEMASWSIPWSFIGWYEYKNELCWIISSHLFVTDPFPQCDAWNMKNEFERNCGGFQEEVTSSLFELKLCNKLKFRSRDKSRSLSNELNKHQQWTLFRSKFVSFTNLLNCLAEANVAWKIRR